MSLYMCVAQNSAKPTILFTFKPIKQLMEVKIAILVSMADPKDIKAQPSLLTYGKNSTSNSQDKR